jgi:hypothetical protein
MSDLIFVLGAAHYEIHIQEGGGGLSSKQVNQKIFSAVGISFHAFSFLYCNIFTALLPSTRLFMLRETFSIDVEKTDENEDSDKCR